MFCTQCGYELEDKDLYCARCGKSTRPGAAPAGSSVGRLSRPYEGRKIAGVCAGFARYLDVDVTLVRIIWLAALLLSVGVVGAVYIVAWILMPSDPAPAVSHACCAAEQRS